MSSAIINIFLFMLMLLGYCVFGYEPVALSLLFLIYVSLIEDEA